MFLFCTDIAIQCRKLDESEIFSLQLLRNVASDSLEFGYKLPIFQVMRKNRRASNKQ
jgi:hypothetical protein